MSAEQNQSLVTDAVLEKLIDDLSFAAGKAAIGVVEGVDSRSPAGVILKQGFNRAYEALLTACQSAKQAQPVDHADLLQSCRSSVKFDLFRYEQILRLGSKDSGHARQIVEAEANRLSALLDSIDAAAQPASEPPQARNPGPQTPPRPPFGREVG